MTTAYEILKEILKISSSEAERYLSKKNKELGTGKKNPNDNQDE